MNKLFSILLVLTLSVPTLRTFIIFLDYQINRSELTDELCENIETDDKCQATCHLVKEVKKESQEKESNPFVPNKNTKNDLLYFQSKAAPDAIIEQYNKQIDVYQYGSSSEHSHEIFHPPKS